MLPRNRIVATAAIGSTAPESAPIRNALPRLLPSPRSGTEIIAPSGMFCIAIPMDKASEPATVRFVSPLITPARTTPTAIPSGMLCSATASIILVERDNDDLGPSAASPSVCWCGMNVSSSSRNAIPAMKPASTGQLFARPSPDCSRAGCRSDQNDAATIMPEANPSMALLAICDILSRSNSTVDAPSTVPSIGTVSPMRISICLLSFSREDIVFFAYRGNWGQE